MQLFKMCITIIIAWQFTSEFDQTYIYLELNKIPCCFVAFCPSTDSGVYTKQTTNGSDSDRTIPAQF